MRVIESFSRRMLLVALLALATLTASPLSPALRAQLRGPDAIME